MSESEGKQDFEGVKWEKELEDDSLATVQEKMRNEFEIDFEELDYNQKGFSKRNSLPFYSDLEGEIEFNRENYQIEIERSGGLNTFEFWTDDSDSLEIMDSFLEEHAASNGGEEMLEPYKYGEIHDTEVIELLDQFDQRLEVLGPERRPGNGQPRIYPVRREHLDDSDDSLDNDSETIPVIGELEEDAENKGYSEEQGYVPGDARFFLEQEEENIEISGEIRIKPEKRETGKYKINLRAEDRQSLDYLINIAEETLRN